MNVDRRVIEVSEKQKSTLDPNKFLQKIYTNFVQVLGLQTTSQQNNGSIIVVSKYYQKVSSLKARAVN